LPDIPVKTEFLTFTNFPESGNSGILLVKKQLQD